MKYKGIYLKLSLVKDFDIIKKLSTLKNMQGYIKELIRSDSFIYKKFKKEGTNE